MFKIIGNFIGSVRGISIGNLICKLPTHISLMTDTEGEGIITSLSLAKTRSVSLRTTVPMSIVKLLGLTAKDKLSWNIRAENGEIAILIKPIKDKKMRLIRS